MPFAAQRSYDIEPGTDLTDNAGFVPLSVLVDNYSPYWLLLPDAGRYVPPYTTGAVLPLIHAETNRATWSQPPLSGLSSTGYIATAGFAHLTFVNVELAYVAGGSVPNTVLSQQASFSVIEGGTITETLDFLASGVRIDNPGGTCYTITGTNLVIPPWTTAWLATFTTPFNTITVEPISNPNGTPNSAVGGPLVATFYAQPVTSSGGTPYTQPSTAYSSAQFSAYNSNAFVMALDQMTGQKQLKSLSLSSAPSVATALNIYRITSDISGYQVQAATMSPFNPSLPAFPGRCATYNPALTIPNPTAGPTATGTTSVIVTLPSFSNGDNIIIAIVEAGVTGGQPNTPTGWAVLQAATGLGLTGGTLFFRQMQNGDPSTVTISYTSSPTTCVAVAYNFYASGPAGTVSQTTTSGITTHTFASTTPPAAKYVAAEFILCYRDPGNTTTSSPYTILTNDAGTGNSYISMAYANNQTANPFTPATMTTANTCYSYNLGVGLTWGYSSGLIYTKGALLFSTPSISTSQLIDLSSYGLIADINNGLVIEMGTLANISNIQALTN